MKKSGCFLRILNVLKNSMVDFLRLYSPKTKRIDFGVDKKR